MKPIINVCVATYKRPQLLKQLLLSLGAQQTDGEFDFNVIVADNDMQRSAEDVVRKSRDDGLPVIYAVEPEQNISLARNTALALADGDYIATIDDDEWASESWLLELYRAITTYDMDAVHGPVSPRFESNTPRHIQECTVFHPPNPPTGSTEKYYYTTANSLFRRKLIEGMTMPFDPKFGRTGGGDTAFFVLLRKHGARMMWCREAKVSEVVPAVKANIPWIVRRRFRYGLMDTYLRENRIIEDDNTQAGNVNRKRMVFSHIKSFVKLSILTAFYLSRGVFNYAHRTKGMGYLQNAGYGLGILAFYGNVHYEEYREK